MVAGADRPIGLMQALMNRRDVYRQRRSQPLPKRKLPHSLDSEVCKQLLHASVRPRPEELPILDQPGNLQRGRSSRPPPFKIAELRHSIGAFADLGCQYVISRGFCVVNEGIDDVQKEP